MYTPCIYTHTNHTYRHTPKITTKTNNNKNDRLNIHGQGKIRDGERKEEKAEEENIHTYTVIEKRSGCDLIL